MNSLGPRRLLMIGAGCMVAVIVTVAAYVIPRVSADPFPGAAPEQAVTAFWVSILADSLVAVALFGAAVAEEPARVSRRVLVATAGLMAMILGLALLDAALAFRGHGPAMVGVANALFACLAVEVVVGLTAFAMAVVRRDRATPDEDGTDDPDGTDLSGGADDSTERRGREGGDSPDGE